MHKTIQLCIFFLTACTTPAAPTKMQELEKRLNILERKFDGVLTNCILEQYSPKDCVIHD